MLEIESKHLIIKMLTGSTTSSPGGSGLPSPAHETSEDNLSKLTHFLHSLAGYVDIEFDSVLQDHCYARPWNWRPENIYVKPVKKIFFTSDHDVRNKLKDDDEIDVEHCDIDDDSNLPYDLTKLRQSMEESEKLASFAKSDDDSDDWVGKIERTLGCSVLQRKLFTRVFNMLSTERLTRLAKTNRTLEPIYRRISTDLATQKFREILAFTGWDWRIIQWLHALLLENLPREYLIIYLDILQTLRAKVPQLVDKMTAIQPNTVPKPGAITPESLSAALKRNWDPVSSCLNSYKPKKLPGNPIIIVAPSGIGTTVSSRQQKWNMQLGSLGTVVTIPSHLGMSSSRMTMMACIEQLVQVTRAKIQDVRSECPGRAIILVGFNTGAALACQVAQLEHVAAVVCLGFPFATAEGNRGTPDDSLLDIRCPILFIIGQNAKLTRTDDIEDIREKLLVESSLVVVGTADDHLRISSKKKLTDGITQSMVDRYILDEIAGFVANILLQPHPLPLRPVGFYNIEKLNRREQRKRKNSTSSSVESESNYPNSTQVQKKSRVTSTGDAQWKDSCVSYNTVHKRKSRSSGSRSKQVDHSAHIVQTNSTTNGGLTLNIGSLASLGTGGPIKLGPNSSTQCSSMQIKSNSSKQAVTFTNVSKMVQTNNQQNVSGKIRNIGSNKMVNRSTSSRSASSRNNYKHINIQDKPADAKYVTVLATAGNQVRVATPTTSAVQNKSMMNSSTHLSALLQNRKCSNDSVTYGDTSYLISNESPTMDTTTITPTTTTTKAMECTRNVYTDSSSGISVTRIPENNAANSEQSSTPFAYDKNTGNQISIVPWPQQNNRKQNNFQHKVLQSPPKIIVNQKSQRKTSNLIDSIVNNNNTTADIDDQLGNILDIPIIFAKDDDNFDVIDKTSSSPSSLSIVNNNDNLVHKIPAKFTSSSTAKVVLLSNKDSKMSRQTMPKIHGKMSEQTTVSPANNLLSENGNIIMRTQTQNSIVSGANWSNSSLKTISRSSNPTIKYTKIILSKRNSNAVFNSHSNDQVIFKKKSQKRSFQVTSQDNKNQQFTAVPVKIISKRPEFVAEDSISPSINLSNINKVNEDKSVTLNNLSEISIKTINVDE